MKPIRERLWDRRYNGAKALRARVLLDAEAQFERVSRERGHVVKPPRVKDAERRSR